MRSRRHGIPIGWLLAALGTVAGPALADPPAADGIAKAQQTCREWTDGCSVCLRREDGAFGCSVPGIACQPAPIVCRVPLASRTGATRQGVEDPR